MNSLYTFFVENEGSTVVEQLIGSSLLDAVYEWSRTSMLEINFLDKKAIIENKPTLVSGLKNAWCFSFIGPKDSLFLVHIIKTENKK